MNKIELFYGILIGFVSTIIGTCLFVIIFTPYTISEAVQVLSANEQLANTLRLGAILNLIAFFVLLHYKKELMARGVFLATIILAIITLLI